MNTLYTAHVDVRSGRDGTVRSEDGVLDARLAFPTSMGGDGKGLNPEQLFAAGYAACFGSTLQAVAKAKGTPLASVELASEVDVLHEEGAFDLAVRLTVRAEGIDVPALEALIETAKTVCPYARATKGFASSRIVVAGGGR